MKSNRIPDAKSSSMFGVLIVGVEEPLNRGMAETSPARGKVGGGAPDSQACQPAKAPKCIELTIAEIIANDE